MWLGVEIRSVRLRQIWRHRFGANARVGRVCVAHWAPTPGAIAVAHPGDVFQLGAHRVVCGSATDSETFRRLMDGGELSQLILTDEPYNVKISGHVTGGAHREFAMASGEMSDAEFLAFNEGWMAAVLPYLCDGGVCGTFIDWRGYPTVFAAASKIRLIPLNLIVWAKTNAGMGSTLPLAARAPAIVQEGFRF